MNHFYKLHSVRILDNINIFITDNHHIKRNNPQSSRIFQIIKKVLKFYDSYFPLYSYYVQIGVFCLCLFENIIEYIGIPSRIINIIEYSLEYIINQIKCSKSVVIHPVFLLILKLNTIIRHHSLS